MKLSSIFPAFLIWKGTSSRSMYRYITGSSALLLVGKMQRKSHDFQAINESLTVAKPSHPWMRILAHLPTFRWMLHTDSSNSGRLCHSSYSRETDRTIVLSITPLATTADREIADTDLWYRSANLCLFIFHITSSPATSSPSLFISLLVSRNAVHPA